MIVAIAGASGLIGTALTTSLRKNGHEVRTLVRRPASAPGEFTWNPEAGSIAQGALVNADAVINLCGAGIGDQRWSGAYKQQLRDSRLIPTSVLTEAVVAEGISTYICTPGIAVYGFPQNTTAPLDEYSELPTHFTPQGDLAFLPTLSAELEEAAHAAAPARVILFRSGPVLCAHSKVISRLRRIYKLGFGSVLGNPSYNFPWISLADEVAALEFALNTPSLHGALNAVSNSYVTNKEFAHAMARTTKTKVRFSVPKFTLPITLGELADEIVLPNRLIRPTKLLDAGFHFQHNTIDSAILS